jgi:hypothetical protein
MLLIDALYINNSGGKVLLDYLVKSIEEAHLSVFYIFDDRCKNDYGYISSNRKVFLRPSIYQRYKFYLKYKNVFSKIFCFGNIPPPIRLQATVYTYFHNVFLLEIPKIVSIKTCVLLSFKKIFLQYTKKYTDYWIVQTISTKKIIANNLNEHEDKILILPFFEFNIQSDIKDRKDYVFVANYHIGKNHYFLLRAWEKLYDAGYNIPLHLTLSNMTDKLAIYLRQCINKGIPIINHGNITRYEVAQLYSISKATIYPSINESFGLGIIEALLSGCDVIAPDMPFVHAVCTPSATFMLDDIKSLVNAVRQYESHPHKSALSINNEIEKLISILK